MDRITRMRCCIWRVWMSRGSCKGRIGWVGREICVWLLCWERRSTTLGNWSVMSSGVQPIFGTCLETRKAADKVAAAPYSPDSQQDGTRVDQGSDQCIQCWRDWAVRESRQPFWPRGMSFRDQCTTHAAASSIMKTSSQAIRDTHLITGG